MVGSSGTIHNIRKLTPSDADECDAIILSLPYHFGNEGGREECARAVRSGSGLVAQHGDTVVGFLTIERHFDSSAEITWMAVRNSHRGQGFGRSLVQRLVADLREEQRSTLLVMTLGPSYDEGDVSDSYDRTRSFYRSVGFVPVREWVDFWPDNPALLMMMRL